jgi:hypothetical protein
MVITYVEGGFAPKVGQEVTEPLAVASGIKTQSTLTEVALSSQIKKGTNSDLSWSLYPARYRERFCTKRFVGFKQSQNCLLGQGLLRAP